MITELSWLYVITAELHVSLCIIRIQIITVLAFMQAIHIATYVINTAIYAIIRVLLDIRYLLSKLVNRNQGFAYRSDHLTSVYNHYVPMQPTINTEIYG